MTKTRIGYGTSLALALGLAGLGCSSRNAMGRSTVTLMPDSFLNSQAASLFAEEKGTKKLATDARKVALTQRVADRLIAAAQAAYPEHCRGFGWETKLFEDPKTVNAYCMPGGKIGIYTGILPVAANEAGLAVVMGHEIAHALLKHGNERVTAQLGVAAVAALAAAAMEQKGGMDGTTKAAILAAVGLGAQVGVVLPNSRVNENEADHMGLRIMALAGYDPAEAPKFWTRMGGGAKDAGPEWVSTHPADARRVKRLGEFQAEVAPLYQAAAAKHGLGETL